MKIIQDDISMLEEGVGSGVGVVKVAVAMVKTIMVDNLRHGGQIEVPIENATQRDDRFWRSKL
ncbi:MAG: hypothetical protein U5O16_17260 [Rhodococcus sp. (in: high G+C Gram-positive bacteria)]|uniref:hypothetical protein n=1 Tax=Rhodococcus sp. TaxID=1831 RepID=UPI002AD727B3|nr:hypothetical protein [Rhodococcus sp. (in: high G+C Gram-positive bacteria)]